MKKQLLLLMLMLVFILPGCTHYYDPPTPEDADTFLKNNLHDIEVIVDYLKALDTDHAYIGRNQSTVFFEFEHHDIIQEDVRDSLGQLWSNGCESITIRRRDNTVYFEIWGRTRGNVSCGIACTLDGQGLPKAELQTECTPISNGWFYYFADYEEYRIRRQNEQSTRQSVG